jgi:hypothetical protein
MDSMIIQKRKVGLVRVQSLRATPDESSNAARLDPNLRWRAGTPTHFFAAQFKDSLTHLPTSPA